MTATVKTLLAALLAQQGVKVPDEPAKPVITTAREWTVGPLGVSKAGYPTRCFTAPTKNGGTFPCTIPGDLYDAIKAGKV